MQLSFPSCCKFGFYFFSTGAWMLPACIIFGIAIQNIKKSLWLLGLAESFTRNIRQNEALFFGNFLILRNYGKNAKNYLWLKMGRRLPSNLKMKHYNSNWYLKFGEVVAFQFQSTKTLFFIKLRPKLTSLNKKIASLI